jgi:hypothetical protein
LVSKDGRIIAKKAVTFGADVEYFGYRVLPHETGHTLCLPDLYFDLPYAQPFANVGGFDIMGDILGISPHHLQWHRWKLGWLGIESIQCFTQRGRYELKLDSRYNANPSMVAIKLNNTAVLVMEARGKGSLADACGRGVLIYVVMDDVDSGMGPIEVLDTTPNSGGCKREELNDAPQKLEASPYRVPHWNIVINVTSELVGFDTGDFIFGVDVEVPDVSIM